MKVVCEMWELCLTHIVLLMRKEFIILQKCVVVNCWSVCMMPWCHVLSNAFYMPKEIVIVGVEVVYYIL